MKNRGFLIQELKIFNRLSRVSDPGVGGGGRSLEELFEKRLRLQIPFIESIKLFSIRNLIEAPPELVILARASDDMCIVQYI